MVVKSPIELAREMTEAIQRQNEVRQIKPALDFVKPRFGVNMKDLKAKEIVEMMGGSYEEDPRIAGKYMSKMSYQQSKLFHPGYLDKVESTQ